MQGYVGLFLERSSSWGYSALFPVVDRVCFCFSCGPSRLIVSDFARRNTLAFETKLFVENAAVCECDHW